jgi:hypothetical protein
MSSRIRFVLCKLLGFCHYRGYWNSPRIATLSRSAVQHVAKCRWVNGLQRHCSGETDLVMAFKVELIKKTLHLSNWQGEY